MSSSSSVLIIIGNLAAIVLVLMVGCLATDTVAGFLGFRLNLFCSGIGLAISIVNQIGVMLTTLGIVMWAMTTFRSATGLGLAFGGMLLGVLPMTLPHYFGVSCAL